jgi:hypothetical protein
VQDPDGLIELLLGSGTAGDRKSTSLSFTAGAGLLPVSARAPDMPSSAASATTKEIAGPFRFI